MPTRHSIACSAAALLAGAMAAWAEPRDAAAYPVRAALGERTLAAEYLARSIPTEGGSLFTTDYLVIEVAFFGPKRDTLKLSTGHFALRMNGKKTPILAQTPGVVASSLKYADQSRPHLEAGGGVGNTGVILGRPPPLRGCHRRPPRRRAWKRNSPLQ
jgi:hypothetical protein